MLKYVTYGLGRMHVAYTMGIASVLFVLVLTAIVQAAPVITQGFKAAETNIVTSAIVGLESSDTREVKLASAHEAYKMLGVVSSESLIELSSGENEVQVVTSGVTKTLVSDINGVVKAGDKVALSPIRGVGMKATENGMIVGTAQADLNVGSAAERTITDKDGKEKRVHIGSVPVSVNVSYYTLPISGASYVPVALQSLANRIAGKDVAPARVLVAALIFLLLFVSVSVLLYSAVRSSIISIGRNPLSEGAVRKSLGQVAVTVVGIVILTVLTIYLVLTL